MAPTFFQQAINYYERQLIFIKIYIWSVEVSTVPGYTSIIRSANDGQDDEAARIKNLTKKDEQVSHIHALRPDGTLVTK